MAYTFDRRKINRKNTVPDTCSSALQKAQLPNSLIMRIMEEPEAEKEADRLSRGITSSTPEDVVREMGSRLGADFSGVRFHSDTAAMNRGQAMGARAWARGSDIYFGRGGFDPATAAHELVHTVQQGAVHGNVSQSVPMGAVQMKPEDEDKNKQIKIGKDADLGPLLLRVFNSELGSKIYKNLKSPLFKLIKKGAGQGFKTCSVDDAVKFLTIATERDYTARGVLTQILENPLNEADDARERLFEYENYIKYLSDRVHEIDLEEAAVNANVKKGPLKYNHKDYKVQKRAYEMDMPDIKSGSINYNPGGNDALEKIQKEIDEAPDAKRAYKIFGRFAGNDKAAYSDKYNTYLNLPKFKTKLKNMVRVIYDYPELKGQIGNMTVINKNGSDEYMGAVGTFGGRKKGMLEYNAFYDSNNPEGEKRKKALLGQSKIYLNGSEDYVGNHELGHILVTTLNEGKNNEEASHIQNDNILEEDILESVLQNPEVMDREKYSQLKRYTDKRVKDKAEKFGQHVLKGQIDLTKSHLPSQGYTSEYGGQNSAEFFAEAVHDVYVNGSKAKKASVEAIKEYEKRQKKVTKNRFFKQKRGIFRKFLDLFKF